MDKVGRKNFLSLQQQIQAIRTDSGVDSIAVSYYDYQTETAWSYQGDRWFHAASTIKVAVLICMFGAIEQGRFKLLSNLHVRNRFLSLVGGTPYQLEYERDSGSKVYAALGRTMKLEELAHHMIVTSNNLATNLLLDLIGIEEAKQILRELGMEGIDLQRGVEDNKAYEANINNRVTASGLVRLFRMLYEGRVFSMEACEKMLDILFKQEFNSGIPAGLPDDIRAAARIAHKTGNISTVSHDTGLVFLKGRKPYAIAILTLFESAASGHSETAIAQVSKVIYEHLMESGVV